ncbi:MAG: UDP-N-acetylmuramoyl-tripeptide--D-alanyl-D-alanine ligase [Bifidobacteriaceae bacterium]|jgi:UDP-N-acetylmuramoyl-tripeptide--D-alanyl-D-alanine ligase|nr:UDP-N-acetylmuramoyl-tripeptide--D-alanyl-D-alanine ligase [Bifidobacteriaceae bacterium]
MIPWTTAALATAVGAKLSPEADQNQTVQGVVIDSRQAGPGVVFVALEGTRVHGADFVEDAFKRGSPLAVVDRAVPGPTVLVPDAARALGHMAEMMLRRARMAAHAPKVIAITGSVGKTTTKDLLARIARQAGRTVAAAGSQNNHLGVPLTVLQTGEATDYLILEMGANHEGEIANLAQIAPPDVAVVLGVSDAHLGEFGSLEAIARTKAELLQALRPDGFAVVNMDDPLVAAMTFQSPERTITFGVDGMARIRMFDVSTRPSGELSLCLEDQDRKQTVRIDTALTGEQLAIDVAAAVAAATAAGIDIRASAAALAGAGPASPHRMAVWRLPGGATLVDDSYNASPESMAAGIRSAAALARGDGLPATAVLGPMLELGNASRAQHRAAGELAAREGFSHLIVVGREARPIHQGAIAAGLPEDAAEFRLNADGLADRIRELDRPGFILIKASQGARLWRVADQLTRPLTEGTGGPGPEGPAGGDNPAASGNSVAPGSPAGDGDPTPGGGPP